MDARKWVDEKLRRIAEMPEILSHTDASSFNCGFNAGYKQAVLDLDRLLESPNKDENKMTFDQCEELIEGIHHIATHLSDISGVMMDVSETIAMQSLADGEVVEAIKDIANAMS